MTEEKPSPVPREKVIFPKLRAPRPAQHRRKPTPEEMAFEGTQTRNRKLNLREKYGKRYNGKHRKEE